MIGGRRNRLAVPYERRWEMFSRLLALGSVGAALLVSAAPAPASAQLTVTATGSASVRVVPKNRKSNASIQAAVDAARKAGIAGALDEAHEYALDYAAAVGFTLGSIESVSDVTSGANSGPLGIYPFIGPFGPNKYCGTQRRPIFKRVGTRSKLVRFKKVFTCFVPAYETTSLSVTYTAT
jgi:hypothetical protein